MTVEFSRGSGFAPGPQPRARPGTSPRPPRSDPGPPYAEVEQIGRWTWAVRVCHGITVWGPNGGAFIVHGSRERADRAAGRHLARYLREEERSARTAHRVTL